MKQRLLTLNHSLLLLCCSLYLGTGWSLLLFSFPIAPSLTTDTYYLQFVPQVTAATKFFTWVTLLMLATGTVMLVAEWRTRLRWVPIVLLLAVIAATLLTELFLLPYNKEMAAGITDAGQLTIVLDRWMRLNKVRIGLWTVQWLAVMSWFVIRANRTGEGANAGTMAL